MKDDAAQFSFKEGVAQWCFWLLWPKDHPAWQWLYRVVWADTYQEPGPLYELLLLSAERPPEQAVPFVYDFLLRTVHLKKYRGTGDARGKMKRRKRGLPKAALYNGLTPIEAAARMVEQYIEQQGITVKAAVDQVLHMKVEPNRFWPDLDRQWSNLDRDKLENYYNGGTGQAWRKRKQRAKLKNLPRFVFDDADLT